MQIWGKVMLSVLDFTHFISRALHKSFVLAAKWGYGKVLKNLQKTHILTFILASLSFIDYKGT